MNYISVTLGVSFYASFSDIKSHRIIVNIWTGESPWPTESHSFVPGTFELKEIHHNDIHNERNMAPKASESSLSFTIPSNAVPEYNHLVILEQEHLLKA